MFKQDSWIISQHKRGVTYEISHETQCKKCNPISETPRHIYNDKKYQSEET